MKKNIWAPENLVDIDLGENDFIAGAPLLYNIEKMLIKKQLDK